MAKDGIAFGTVNIDSFIAALEVKKGDFEITKFDVKSKDLDLKLELSMTLAQEINDSMVNGCARYKPTDALAKREGNTFSAFMMIGGPLGPDTMYHVRLDGTLKDMGKKALVCGPETQQGGDGGGKKKGNSTPSLSGIPQPTMNGSGSDGQDGAGLRQRRGARTRTRRRR